MTVIAGTLLLLLHCLSFAFALPSNIQKPGLALVHPKDITSKNATINTTIRPNPLTAPNVICLQTHYPPTLINADCNHVINVMILQQPNLMKSRTFKSYSYETDDGVYARSRWQHGACEVGVSGNRGDRIAMSLLYVGWTAHEIFNKCIEQRPHLMAIGGMSPVGDVSKGFHVVLQGFNQIVSATANSSDFSQLSDTSISKRTLQSRHDSQDPSETDIRASPRETSLMSNPPAISANLNANTAINTEYLVRCFDPLSFHLQPAAETDCDHIITQTILRLRDPTAELTFGYTGAADIDLSEPQYQQWRFGQCSILITNNNMAEFDTFRLLDVAASARKITNQCLGGTAEKLGGAVRIGSPGRGFRVYVGAPIDVGSVVSG